eukprot:SAG31_NODE_5039_length_2782_cov_1.722326_1_plen_74_part_00
MRVGARWSKTVINSLLFHSDSALSLPEYADRTIGIAAASPQLLTASDRLALQATMGSLLQEQNSMVVDLGTQE